MKEYDIENYVEPERSYRTTLCDKFKVGHLIYDNNQQRIKIVDIAVLQEILLWESKDVKGSKLKYIPIYLTHEWLVNVFDFESKYMATNSITVYTSLRNGMKVHGQRGRFFVGVTIREKMDSMGMAGTHFSKPSILFVNELMDYSFLLKRDMIDFNKNDLITINKVMNLNN
ncbi:hypothetical protein [Arenibacter algicola]|uniref:hypothetical protein n=1 Tax=Arenibacter algicola TaxID=616991 RepID=UPI0004DECF83|nr:hypothetical protein [Arenibacter algicola]